MEGGREGWMEGGSKGGRQGGREAGREGGREGGREKSKGRRDGWSVDEFDIYVTVSEKRGHSMQNTNFQLEVPADSAKPNSITRCMNFSASV